MDVDTDNWIFDVAVCGWRVMEESMREILFKAKEINTGEWIEGFLIKDMCEEEWCMGCLYGGAPDVMQIGGRFTDQNYIFRPVA